jgi:GH24 family phage-related lysozyme (muramidase)
MSYIDAAALSTLQWEGAIPWMYLDGRGNVTVGCGLLLLDVGAACGLPFQMQTGESASEDMISVDFHRVEALPSNKLPGFYHSDLSPVLARSSISSLLRQYIVSDDAALKKAYSGWDGYPDSAKQALLDMAFNLGVSGLLHRYPHLGIAIESKNWLLAAEACHRLGISNERNNWTKNLFISASKIA